MIFTAGWATFGTELTRWPARGNKETTIRLRFPAVRVDRLRLRILGSARPDNAFAHVAELTALAAAGQPERRLQPSPFPPTPADAGHDPATPRRLIRSLENQTGASRAARRRLAALKRRLALIEESRPYEAMLKQIGKQTERLRRLRPPEWPVAQRDAMARMAVIDWKNPKWAERCRRSVAEFLPSSTPRPAT